MINLPSFVFTNVGFKIKFSIFVKNGQNGKEKCDLMDQFINKIILQIYSGNLVIFGQWLSLNFNFALKNKFLRQLESKWKFGDTLVLQGYFFQEISVLEICLKILKTIDHKLNI